MKKEYKELLFKDLSARLPYRVKVYYQQLKLPFILFEVNLKGEVLTLTDNSQTNYFVQYVENSKPYLRPLSSMTDEERHEIQEILGKDVEIPDDFINIIDSSRKSFSFIEIQAVFDFLNAHYLDFRGLIPKGLALEALDDMYNK